MEDARSSDIGGPASENVSDAGAILLCGGTILNLTASRVEAADVLIENATIARVGPHGAFRAPAARQLDATGCIIVPGITNAHTHSPENLAAGFCDGLVLDDWLKAIWGELDHLSPQAIELCVYLGAAQMLKRGVTAVVDHFRQTPMSLTAVDSARSAYEKAGLRAMIAVMLRDRVAGDGKMVGVATKLKPVAIDEAREIWTEIARRHNPQSRVALALGPSGATRCSDAMLALAVEIASRYALCLHTHVAETHACAQMALNLFGCRTITHLKKLGFLGRKTSLAHCVWIDNEEIGLIAESGAAVVHNPISNMILGSGTAPVPAMRKAGAHIAVGTDGAASNGGQDIFESIKCAALLSRNDNPDPADWVTAGQAFDFAIRGGREIFGLAPAEIAPGAVADVAVFPFTEEALDKFFDPVRQLVFGAPPQARHVLVAGDPVVVDGEIKTFDESALRAELSGLRAKSSTSQIRK